MTDVLGAIKHLGKCLREGKETFMGVPAENVCIAAADEIERLRAALKPFAEVPPGGRGVGARMMVTFAGDGPFHFFEGDLVRAKEVYRGLEQCADGGKNG